MRAVLLWLWTFFNMPPWIRDAFRRHVIWATFVPWLLPVDDRPDSRDAIDILLWAQSKEAQSEPGTGGRH